MCCSCLFPDVDAATIFDLEEVFFVLLHSKIAGAAWVGTKNKKREISFCVQQSTRIDNNQYVHGNHDIDIRALADLQD